MLISVALTFERSVLITEVLTQDNKKAGTHSYFYNNNVTGTVKSSTGVTPSWPSALESIMPGGGPREDDCLPTTQQETLLDCCFFHSFPIGQAIEYYLFWNKEPKR